MSLLSTEEIDLLGDSKYRAYISQVEKALRGFENTSEWADLIAALSKLNKVLSSQSRYHVIPKRVTIGKRLAQCLHPALPSGVHMKVLETYEIILTSLGSARLAAHLFTYTAGLLPLMAHAASNVRPLLLSLYETHLLPLGQGLQPALTGLLLALLPGMEDTAEHHARTSLLCERLCEVTDSTYFYGCLWRCILSTTSIRLAAITFILAHFHRKQTMEDQIYMMGSHVDTLVEALCSCFLDCSVLVQRSALDLALLAFPLHSRQLTRSDMLRLASAIIMVILRRDVSLNRRLYAWLLGTDAAGACVLPGMDPGDSLAYFHEYSQTLLIAALHNCITEHRRTPVAAAALDVKAFCVRPLRILNSLMDRPELDVLKHITLHLLRFLHEWLSGDADGGPGAARSTRRHHQAASAELVKTANLLFAAFEPSFTWQFLERAFQRAFIARRRAKVGVTAAESNDESNIVDEQLNKRSNEADSGSSKRLSGVSDDEEQASFTELCVLTEFLLQKISLETFVETQTEQLPRLLRRLLDGMLRDGGDLNASEMSSGLRLCSRLLSHVQPSLCRQPSRQPDTAATAAAADDFTEFIQYSSSCSSERSASRPWTSVIEVCLASFQTLFQRLLARRIFGDDWVLKQGLRLMEAGPERGGKERKGGWSPEEGANELLSCLCKLLLDFSCLPHCSSKEDESSSFFIDSQDLPLWLQWLLASACCAGDFDIQTVAIATAVDLLGVAHSYAPSGAGAGSHRGTGSNGTVTVQLLPSLTTHQLDYINTKTYFYTVVAGYLWKHISDDSLRTQQRAVQVFYQLHQVAPHENVCEDVICEGLLSRDKVLQLVAHQRFAILWHLLRDTTSTSPASQLRTFDRAMFVMMDSLQLSEHVGQTASQTWLAHSIERGDVSRLLDPLLGILLHPDTARVSVQYSLSSAGQTGVPSPARDEAGHDEDKILGISSENGQVVYHVGGGRRPGPVEAVVSPLTNALTSFKQGLTAAEKLAGWLPFERPHVPDLRVMARALKEAVPRPDSWAGEWSSPGERGAQRGLVTRSASRNESDGEGQAETELVDTEDVSHAETGTAPSRGGMDAMDAVDGLEDEGVDKVVEEATVTNGVIDEDDVVTEDDDSCRTEDDKVVDTTDVREEDKSNNCSSSIEDTSDAGSGEREDDQDRNVNNNEEDSLKDDDTCAEDDTKAVCTEDETCAEGEEKTDETCAEDTAQIDETCTEVTTKVDESCAEDEMKVDETCTQDETKIDETCTEDETKIDDTSAEDEVKIEDTCADDELQDDESRNDDGGNVFHDDGVSRPDSRNENTQKDDDSERDSCEKKASTESNSLTDDGDEKSSQEDSSVTDKSEEQGREVDDSRQYSAAKIGKLLQRNNSHAVESGMQRTKSQSLSGNEKDDSRQNSTAKIGKLLQRNNSHAMDSGMQRTESLSENDLSCVALRVADMTRSDMESVDCECRGVPTLYCHTLLYTRQYDCARTLYALSCLRALLTTCPRLLVCTLATSSLGGSGAAPWSPRLVTLLARHRLSLLGHSFSGVLPPDCGSIYRKSMYLETLISIVLYFIRSRYASGVTGASGGGGNEAVWAGGCEVLTLLFTELVALSRGSGRGFTTFLSDLLARCKLQKALLHCLLASEHREGYAAHPELGTASAADADADLNDTFQIKLLRLVVVIVVLEDEIYKSADIVIDSVPALAGAGPVPAAAAVRYASCRRVIEQEMWLVAVCTALRPAACWHMQRHWLAAVCATMPYMGTAAVRIVSTVVSLICENLQALALHYCRPDTHPEMEACLSPDHMVYLLESLSTICHYYLLDNSQQDASLRQTLPANSFATETSGATQMFTNLLSMFNVYSSSREASPAKEVTISPVLDVQHRLLELLPLILSSVATVWKATKASESCGKTQACWSLGSPKSVRQVVLQLVSPLSRHHAANLVAAVAVVWNEGGGGVNNGRPAILLATEDQLLLVDLIASIKVLPMDTLMQTVRQVIKQPPASVRRHKGGCVGILQFFCAYMERTTGKQLADSWPNLLALLRDTLQLELPPPAIFLLLVTVSGFVQKIPMFEERKDQKDLQEIVQKFLEACSDVAGASLEQTSWLSRGLEVKPGLQADPEALDQTNLPDVVSCADPRRYYSVQALTMLASYTATLLDVVYRSEEKERVVPFLTAIMHNVYPYLRNHTRQNISSFCACARLLANLSGYQYTRRVWRRETFDLLFEPRFFYMQYDAMQHWATVIDNLMTHDRTTFRDFLGRVIITAGTSLNLFSSREQEFEQGAQLLKRLSFVIFCSETDQYYTFMSEIQERLFESLRANSASLQAQVFLSLRVLMLRLSAQHLTSLWPTVITELVQVLVQIEQELCPDYEELSRSQPSRASVALDASWALGSSLNSQRNPRWLQLYLAACKLLDLALVLPPEALPQFQLYRWAFVGDNCEDPSGFMPHCCRIAKLMNQRFGDALPRRRPEGRLLLLSSTILSIKDLQPFFACVSLDAAALPLASPSLPLPALTSSLDIAHIQRRMCKSYSAPDVRKSSAAPPGGDVDNYLEHVIGSDFLEPLL